MAEKNIYYIYAHKEKDSGDIFYLGKGHANRATQTYGRSEKWKSYADSGYVVEIIEKNLSEADSLAKESVLIDLLMPPANICKKGSYGTSGYKHDRKTVERRNQMTRDRNKDPAFKLKLSLAQKEARSRPEVIEKSKKSHLELRARIARGEIKNPWLGRKPLSKESIQKIKDKQSGEKGFWYGKITSGAKKVINVDTGEVFDSIKLAAKSVSGHRTSLRKRLDKGLPFKKRNFKYV